MPRMREMVRAVSGIARPRPRKAEKAGVSQFAYAV
jgi:hypothetical protein